MLGANKILRYKKIVSLLLLIFCFALAGLTTIGLILNLTPNNIAILRTTAGVVKFELTDNITKEDNTIDKLSQKIKISGNGNKGQLSGLVAVASKNVMFSYEMDNQSYYFSAMDKNVNKISVATYASTSSEEWITGENGWDKFRQNINDGIKDYANTIVYVNGDISFGYSDRKISVKPITGTFKGILDGQNFTLSNFIVGPNIYDGYVGLFATNEGTIKNLKIDNAELNFSDMDNQYVNSGGDYNEYRGIGHYYDSSSHPKILYAGILVGENQGGKISQCSILNSNVYVRAAGLNEDTSRGQTKQMIGGIVGGAYSTTIENCSADVDFDVADWNQANVCVGGIVGGWTYLSKTLKIENCFYYGSATLKYVTGNFYWNSGEEFRFGSQVFFNFGGILGGSFELQPVLSSNHQNYQNKITLGKNHVKLTNISLNGCDYQTQNNVISVRNEVRFSFQAIFGGCPLRTTTSEGAANKEFWTNGFTSTAYLKLDTNNDKTANIVYTHRNGYDISQTVLNKLFTACCNKITSQTCNPKTKKCTYTHRFEDTIRKGGFTFCMGYQIS